jgi:type II secretory pathway pseudopilin PulG
MSSLRKIQFRAGQSIIELLVAIGVGVILIVGAISVLGPTIKTQGDTTRLQVAAGLGKGLLDNVVVFADSDWHNISTLATSSARKYYLIASTSPFVAASGTEAVLVATTTYTRYFYVDDVFFNAYSQIDVDGTFYNPSVKKIIVVYGWGTATNTMATYVSRTNNSAFVQTDWSAGPTQGVATVTTTLNGFGTSTNISYVTSTASPTSTTGSLIIRGF